jgi:hypothetical protein
MPGTETSIPAGATEASEPKPIEAEPADTASDTAAQPESTDAVATRNLRPWFAASGASVGVAAAAAGVALLVAASRRSLEIDDDESLVMSLRPRRSVGQYLLTLGLWEFTRRSTRFAVTDRRVMIDQGLMRRTTRSIPISSITNVRVVAGPWEGGVELARAGTGARAEMISPLRSPRAREFARAVITARNHQR